MPRSRPVVPARDHSIGNAVRAHSARNAADAPATVSGESPAIDATGTVELSWEGGWKQGSASQETGHQVISHARPRRAGWTDVERKTVAHSTPRGGADCGDGHRSR